VPPLLTNNCHHPLLTPTYQTGLYDVDDKGFSGSFNHLLSTAKEIFCEAKHNSVQVHFINHGLLGLYQFILI